MTADDLLYKLAIPLIAAFIGAFCAFWYQRRIERQRDKRAVLQTLIAYRNAGANELDWIKALNLVDLVFHEHKRVRELLHKYIAYTKPDLYPSRQHIDVLFQMMYEMAQCCGYTNLSLADIRDIYAPEALLTHYPHMRGTPMQDEPKDGGVKP